MANTPAPRAAANAATLAQPGRTLDPIQRQAPTPQNLWAATARTNRALSLLKQASADAYTGGGSA